MGLFHHVIAMSKIDNVLTEHGGLLHVLPHAVPHEFSVRSSPLGTNLGFGLSCTGSGFGLGGFVT